MQKLGKNHNFGGILPWIRGPRAKKAIRSLVSLGPLIQLGWGHLGLYLKFKAQNLGYLSPMFLEAKFGVSVTYVFGGKIWGSDMNFRGKIWGRAPRPPNWKYPLWEDYSPLISLLLPQTGTGFAQTARTAFLTCW